MMSVPPINHTERNGYESVYFEPDAAADLMSVRCTCGRRVGATADEITAHAVSFHSGADETPANAEILLKAETLDAYLGEKPHCGWAFRDGAKCTKRRGHDGNHLSIVNNPPELVITETQPGGLAELTEQVAVAMRMYTQAKAQVEQLRAEAVETGQIIAGLRREADEAIARAESKWPLRVERGGLHCGHVRPCGYSGEHSPHAVEEDRRPAGGYLCPGLTPGCACGHTCEHGVHDDELDHAPEGWCGKFIALAAGTPWHCNLDPGHDGECTFIYSRSVARGSAASPLDAPSDLGALS